METRKHHLKKPRIYNESAVPVALHLRRLGQHLGKKRRRNSAVSSWQGWLSIPGARLQRSIVKCSYMNNQKTRSWAAHGSYLQREHAQHPDEKGMGFNEHESDIDLKTRLGRWQKAGDLRLFKLILSPEFGERVDLKQHVIALMQQASEDLHCAIEWMAIDHHNTDKPHAHVLIRGRDKQGQALTIDADYIAHGFRERSQALLTQSLGLRTQMQVNLARQHQIEKQWFTDIDKTLLFKASGERIVSYEQPVPLAALARERRLQDMARLKYLESLGLATRLEGKRWALSPQLEKTLRSLQLSNDIIKSRTRQPKDALAWKTSLIFTPLEEGVPLTGKILGMGLENALVDKRYLLLHGSDGRIHTIEATPSMIKANDTRRFKKGELVILCKKRFINQEKKAITYVAVSHARDIRSLKKHPEHLDNAVIATIKQTGQLKFEQTTASHFLKNYRRAMRERANALEKASVILKRGAHYVLSSDWDKKLDNLHIKHIAPNTTILDRTKNPLPVAGEVMFSNDCVLLVKNLCGQTYQLSFEQLKVQQSPSRGSFVYIAPERARLSEKQTPALATLHIIHQKKTLLYEPRYNVLDAIISKVSWTANKQTTLLAQQLEERKRLWQCRGIDANTQKTFEKAAHAWLEKTPSLAVIKKQSRLPFELAKPNHTYQGELVANGISDEKGQVYGILKTANSLVAVPAPVHCLSQKKLGETVSMKAMPVVRQVFYQGKTLQRKLVKKPRFNETQR